MWNHLLLLCIWLSTAESWISPTLNSPKSTIYSSLFAAQKNSDGGGISIRPAEYSELHPVSDIILHSFYDKKIHNGPWKRVYKLAELNRIQQNFPYQETDLHQMLVAIDDESARVVGFADIDARPCRTKIRLPRPYLSDLCVDADFRRRGIANRLVQACERFVQSIPRSDLWIRVKKDNQAAVQMYHNLKYAMEDGQDEKDPDILVLHKIFDKTIGTKNEEGESKDTYVSENI